MIWKNLPYWLRYGVIFVVIFVIIVLFLLIATSQSRTLEGAHGPSPLILPLFPGLWIDSFTFDVQDSYPPASITYQIFILGLYSAIFWFIVGAIIGLIVGRIKSSNK